MLLYTKVALLLLVQYMEIIALTPRLKTSDVVFIRKFPYKLTENKLREMGKRKPELDCLNTVHFKRFRKKLRRQRKWKQRLLDNYRLYEEFPNDLKYPNPSLKDGLSKNSIHRQSTTNHAQKNGVIQRKASKVNELSGSNQSFIVHQSSFQVSNQKRTIGYQRLRRPANLSKLLRKSRYHHRRFDISYSSPEPKLERPIAQLERTIKQISREPLSLQERTKDTWRVSKTTMFTEVGNQNKGNTVLFPKTSLFANNRYPQADSKSRVKKSNESFVDMRLAYKLVGAGRQHPLPESPYKSNDNKRLKNISDILANLPEFRPSLSKQLKYPIRRISNSRMAKAIPVNSMSALWPKLNSLDHRSMSKILNSSGQRKQDLRSIINHPQDSDGKRTNDLDNQMPTPTSNPSSHKRSTLRLDKMPQYKWKLQDTIPAYVLNYYRRHVVNYIGPHFALRKDLPMYLTSFAQSKGKNSDHENSNFMEILEARSRIEISTNPSRDIRALNNPITTRTYYEKGFAIQNVTDSKRKLSNGSWYLNITCKLEKCMWNDQMTNATLLINHGWSVWNCTSVIDCKPVYENKLFLQKFIGVLLLILSICLIMIVIGFSVYYARYKRTQRKITNKETGDNSSSFKISECEFKSSRVRTKNGNKLTWNNAKRPNVSKSHDWLTVQKEDLNFHSRSDDGSHFLPLQKRNLCLWPQTDEIQKGRNEDLLEQLKPLAIGKYSDHIHNLIRTREGLSQGSKALNFRHDYQNSCDDGKNLRKKYEKELFTTSVKSWKKKRDLVLDYVYKINEKDYKMNPDSSLSAAKSSLLNMNQTSEKSAWFYMMNETLYDNVFLLNSALMRLEPTPEANFRFSENQKPSRCKLGSPPDSDFPCTPNSIKEFFVTKDAALKSNNCLTENQTLSSSDPDHSYCQHVIGVQNSATTSFLPRKTISRRIQTQPDLENLSRADLNNATGHKYYNCEDAVDFLGDSLSVRDFSVCSQGFPAVDDAQKALSPEKYRNAMQAPIYRPWRSCETPSPFVGSDPARDYIALCYRKDISCKSLFT